jgi:hypothetical protein
MRACERTKTHSRSARPSRALTLLLLPPPPPQPQTNKATRFHQRAARPHLKDWLLAYEGQMASVTAATRDNTGARRYIEGVRPRTHTLNAHSPRPPHPLRHSYSRMRRPCQRATGLAARSRAWAAALSRAHGNATARIPRISALQMAELLTPTCVARAPL